MFAPISALFSLLFLASTLPNGIRLVELPAEGDSVEIVAGYTSPGLNGFTSTDAAKSLLYDAYASGAKIDFVDDLDRTALRIKAPKWALPVLMERLPPLFTSISNGPRSMANGPSDDFRSKVEEEIRSALLGQDLAVPDAGTENAFVLISAPAPNSLREALAAIPKRSSSNRPEASITRLPAERTLRFKSELDTGAVIFASPIPGVYYKQWFLVLVLDRLIHRIVPLPLKTAFVLSVRPYYYRLELPVPAGQFPEPVEENLLQELQRLQFTPAKAQDLMAARNEALAYLDSKPIKEWFASHDLLARRNEGTQWIEAMSADDLRVAARDLLIMNRVIATWAPKPRQTLVTTESLNTTTSPPPPSPSGRWTRAEGAQGEGPLTQFPNHTHSTISTALPERLSSGVSLVASSTNAIFISGGTITRFDHDFTPDDLPPFQQYRADRILVLTPASSLERARQLWSAFKGNPSGETGVPHGKISSGDLSALSILKTILDLKIIQSGWWPETSVRIDSSAGTDLQIRASDEKREQILAWIKAIANAPLSDNYFAWVREVAIHQFETIRPDVQALTWEHDSQGTIQDLETVSARHVQDVARIYF